jgi:replicative DNA helicase
VVVPNKISRFLERSSSRPKKAVDAKARSNNTFIMAVETWNGVTMARRTGEANGEGEKETGLTELLARGVPPQNQDAERTVLGGILRNNDCLPDVVRKLRSEHFYHGNHQKIYSAIVSMYDQGKPIDAVSLAEELARRKQLKEVGGAPLLLELFNETLTAAHVMHHAEIVFEKYVMRNLIATSTELLRDAYTNTVSADELLADAEKRVFSLLQDRSGREANPIDRVLNDVLTRISARQGGKLLGGVPSGFRDLDEMTNGWQRSELIILAARPAVGKTSFALNMVDHAAVVARVPTLMVSLEMSEMELAERMLCSRGRVNSHFVRRGRASKEDIGKLVVAHGELGEAPIFIDDTPGQTMLRIAATARRIKLRHNLGLVVIDYLQLIEADDKRASRVEQIGTISRRLKTLARELNVPVIALSQLNRAVESREGHRPRMADLRESGSIEQDADVVALLHREDAFDPESENKGQAELILAKQRNGPVGDIKLTFIKELTRFEDHAEEIVAFKPADATTLGDDDF